MPRSSTGAAHPRRPAATIVVAAVASLGLAAPALAAPPWRDPGPGAGTVFISEIHYDNAGRDVGEFVEVRMPAGSHLLGWSVVLYDADGVVYDTSKIRGAAPHGTVVLRFGSESVLNGTGGLALVDASGGVVEFLSYGGTVTATDGPAVGLSSQDIGVLQDETPRGLTLQRVGSTWTGPVASTRGELNPQPEPDPGAPGDTHTIAQIQGTGDASPVAGETVTTSGVVTAAYPAGGFNGYYLQTAGSGGDTDLSARTGSDAVFVFSPDSVGSVRIGDHLQVAGYVAEYNGLTEIDVSAGGASVLDTPAQAVKPIEGFTLPGTDVEREVFEGMLVHPVADYVVSDTYALGGWGDSAFGSVGLGLDGPLVQETDVALPGTPEFDAVAADNEARAVTLDDGRAARTSSDEDIPYLTGEQDVRTGVGLDFVAPVIVDYRFGWNFQPTAPVDGNADDVVHFGTGNTQAANAAAHDVGGDLRIATFNVLNYFTTLGADLPGCTPYTDRDGNPLTVSGGCDARGAWDEANLQRQEDKIVAAINGLDADVVSLEEIENSARFGQDRDATLGTLVDALNAEAGAGTWAFAPSPAVLPDLAEQDVIRTAFIYRPASVRLAGGSTVLVGSAAFDNAREPLAQAFTTVGGSYTFLTVSNHFKSKGGDCGDLAVGCFDADRVAQAQALTSFAGDVAGDAGITDVFLLGDFNAYSAENPVVQIEDAGYTNLDTEETTYVFDGKVGSVDHVFANASAQSRVTGVDVWGINSAESVLKEYSRYNYFGTLYYETDQFRSSDHDPIVVGIDVP